MKTLEYMGAADAQEVLNRVTRQIMAMEDCTEPRNESEQQEHAHLCEVAQACETVIGFLNGEYAEFCEKRNNRSLDDHSTSSQAFPHNI